MQRQSQGVTGNGSRNLRPGVPHALLVVGHRKGDAPEQKVVENHCRVNLPHVAMIEVCIKRGERPQPGTQQNAGGHAVHVMSGIETARAVLSRRDEVEQLEG